MSVARAIAVVFSFILLTGCAGLNQTRAYVYPVAGQSPGQQVDDSAICKDWARDQSGYDAAGAAVTGGVTGVVVGATIGAIIGAIVCAPVRAAEECAALGAAVGGWSGGLRGAAMNVDVGRANFSRAFGTCMTAKGYAAGVAPCRDRENLLGVWDAQLGFCRVIAILPHPPPPPPPLPGLAPDPLAENTEMLL